MLSLVSRQSNKNISVMELFLLLEKNQKTPHRIK